MNLGSKSFWTYAAVSGALAACSGCTAEDVSVGNESTAINLDRCYGQNTRCARATSTPAGEAEARPCDTEPSGSLESDFEVPMEGAERLAVSPDGTVWVLGKASWSIGEGTYWVWLAHFTAEGELIGRNESVNMTEGGGGADAELAVDADGNAYVSIFLQAFDRSEKDDFTEYTTIQRFDAQAVAVGPAIQLSGTAGAALIAGPDEYFTLAGDAPYNAHHGVVTRLQPDGAPLWIQNDVPSVGEGVGWGVSGVVLDGKGETTLISERARNYDADESTFGLSHYDADGNELWSWTLPKPFAGGTNAQIALGPDGNYVVYGDVRVISQEYPGGAFTQLVQSFSADADKRWAFQLSGSPGLTVDSETRSTIVGANNGIAVIDEDGAACKVFASPEPPSDGSASSWSSWGRYYVALQSVGERIYYLDQQSFGSFRVVPAQ